MPKAKIEPENNNSHELDPIIDALLIHLPAPGDYFAKDDRKKWLQMMELSFDLIYDDEPEPQTTDEPGLHGH
jgi:hypothetical protein